MIDSYYDSYYTSDSFLSRNYRLLVPTRNKILIESEECFKEPFDNSNSSEEVLWEGIDGVPELFSLFLFIDQNKQAVRLTDFLLHPSGVEFIRSLIKKAPVFDWSYQVYQGQKSLALNEQEIVSGLIYGAIESDKFSLHLYEVQNDWDEEFKLSPQIKSFEYQDVLFKEPKLDFDNSKLTFSVKHNFDLKKIRLLGGLYHDTQNNALFFSREEQIREDLRSLFSADNLQFMYKSLGFTVEIDSLKKSISYETSFFDNPIEKLEKLKKFFPENMKLSYASSKRESTSLTLNFKTSEKSYLELYHDSSQSDFVLNKVLRIFIGFKYGMATFQGYEAAQAAIKGPKRFNEIKLLKSSGFFMALVKMALLEKEDLSLDALWDHLKPYTLEYLESSTKDTIDSMLSNLFKDKVFDVFKNLTNIEEFSVNTVEDGKVVELNFYKAIQSFFKPLMFQMEDHYKDTLYYMNYLKDLNFNLIQKQQETFLEMDFPFALEVGNFMDHNICHLEKEAIQEFNTKLLEARIEVKNSALRKGSEWFDLNPKYYFNGKEISEDEAKTFQKNSLVRYQDQLYYISEKKSPVVKWLNYFWRRAERAERIERAERADKKETAFKPLKDNPKDKSKNKSVLEGHYKVHVLDILALKHAGLPVEGGTEWECVVNEYDSIGKPIKVNVKNFQGVLKPFQEIGVSWLIQLYKLGLGGILADDMGLGKTVQILAFLNHLKNLEGKKRVLVVVPTSLVYNWESETAKFTFNLKTAHFTKDWPKNNNLDDKVNNLNDKNNNLDDKNNNLDDKVNNLNDKNNNLDDKVNNLDDKNNNLEDKVNNLNDKNNNLDDKNNNLDDIDILICTYGLMSEHQDYFKEVDWNIVVFDEAQQLKNIKSIRSEVSRKLSADFKICLSGTPMENHYGEYYSLIDLTVPGALGDYKSFLRVYGPRKVSVGQVSQSEVDYLKLKTKPLVLRRTKSQVLSELPEKTESVVKINFDEQQKEIYKNVAMVWNSKIQNLMNSQGESKSQIQMFSALMKLRQICSCPNAVKEVSYTKLSPKLSLVVDRVKELVESDNSVLVFTNFILTLDTLKNELIKKGIAPLSITGKLAQKKREEVLTEFNTEGPKALLMTLKTGGVGLNLTKANYILHVEPWWNPAAESQGTDRAHRIGQTKKVHVYRYIMRNSIEEKIQELKQLKKQAFEGLLEKDTQNLKEGTFTGSSGLSKKDFEYLLS